MREFVIISVVLVMLLVLQGILVASAEEVGLGMLASLLAAAPFAFMGWVNLREARKRPDLTPARRLECRVRGVGFTLAALPIFLRDVLPYFVVYCVGIFTVTNIVAGIVEARGQK